MSDHSTSGITPEVQSIRVSDLSSALRRGIQDFAHAPMFGLAISGFFVLGGLVIFLQLTVWDSGWLILPITVGFPLLGPFVVVGLYEVSHLLESGKKPTWEAILRRIFQQKDRQIPSIAFVVTFFFGVWFYLAHLIFALFFGLSAMTNISSSYSVLLSTQGAMMFAVGSIVGGLLAFGLFAISVVSIPLLVDREVDFVTGMIVSVQSVLKNFWVMILWGGVVATLTLIAMVPAFLGLLFVLPVLGHATWHLYRTLIK